MLCIGFRHDDRTGNDNVFCADEEDEEEEQDQEQEEQEEEEEDENRAHDVDEEHASGLAEYPPDPHGCCPRVSAC